MSVSTEIVPEPGFHPHAMQSGTEHRTFWVQIPAALENAGPLPLVVLLHGRTSFGRQAAEYTRMRDQAEAERYIAVYPDALGNPRAWNARYNSGRNNGEDLDFLRRLLDRLRQRLPVDPARVYVAGHSSGGMMTYYLGAVCARELAAIAVVAGSIGAQRAGEPLQRIPDPAAPLSVIALHGRKDRVVPYAEKDRPRSQYPHFLPASESLRFWLHHNACLSEPEVVDLAEGRVREERYRTARGELRCVLCTLEQGNHHWPGARPLPQAGDILPNPELDATGRILEFFRTHRRITSA